MAAAPERFSTQFIDIKSVFSSSPLNFNMILFEIEAFWGPINRPPTNERRNTVEILLKQPGQCYTIYTETLNYYTYLLVFVVP